MLLGMKKRGFGTGKWNGFGGKVEVGETVADAAQRELEEEVLGSADCQCSPSLLLSISLSLYLSNSLSLSLTPSHALSHS